MEQFFSGPSSPTTLCAAMVSTALLLLFSEFVYFEHMKEKPICIVKFIKSKFAFHQQVKFSLTCLNVYFWYQLHPFHYLYGNHLQCCFI